MTQKRLSREHLLEECLDRVVKDGDYWHRSGAFLADVQHIPRTQLSPKQLNWLEAIEKRIAETENPISGLIQRREQQSKKTGRNKKRRRQKKQKK